MPRTRTARVASRRAFMLKRKEDNAETKPCRLTNTLRKSINGERERERERERGREREKEKGRERESKQGGINNLKKKNPCLESC